MNVVKCRQDSSCCLRASLLFGVLLAASTLRADALLTSWLTTYSGQYARIYTNDAAKTAGTTVTTWSNNSLSQSLPAYCGVQQISYSSSWVYILTTGLGSHNMGPWYSNSGHTQTFPNLPTNQKIICRFPRTSVVPNSRSFVPLGEIGCFVDGVRMFDANDAYSYSTANNKDADPTANIGQGDGIWNRDAWVNEGVTFDAGYAHQQNTGRYHYHASPIALRYLLGDHVDYNSTTKAYSESTATPTKHSPILGWMQDGYPLYGPYGYSSATVTNSGVRRMVSGYVQRNGSNSADNLNSSGRHAWPAWAARAYGGSTNLISSKYGPNVSTTYPIGQYLEDYAYLGDLGKVQGTDFDLDEYNGRFCKTPEFPNGTYAYFTTISASGTPIYPYNMGRLYYGTSSGGIVSSISESVTTNFLGGADAALKMNSPSNNNNTVTLTWSAVEGGTYKVEAKSDLAAVSWSTVSNNVTPVKTLGQATDTAGNSLRVYRVSRTAIATYDPATGGSNGGTGGSGGNGIVSVSPTSGNRNSTITLTINLDSAMNPPPQTAPVNSVTVGTITGTSNTHVSQTQVTTKIVIPSNATTGAQTVSVVFPGPPSNPSQTVTYTLTNGFTIN